MQNLLNFICAKNICKSFFVMYKFTNGTSVTFY